MGLQVTAAILCDNCNGSQTPLTSLQSPEAPLPDNWCRVQGYANISNGESQTVDGYFCPVCVGSQGTKALVKKAADVSPDLTAAQ